MPCGHGLEGARSWWELPQGTPGTESPPRREREQGELENPIGGCVGIRFLLLPRAARRARRTLAGREAPEPLEFSPPVQRVLPGGEGGEGRPGQAAPSTHACFPASRQGRFWPQQGGRAGLGASPCVLRAVLVLAAAPSRVRTHPAGSVLPRWGGSGTFSSVSVNRVPEHREQLLAPASFPSPLPQTLSSSPRAPALQSQDVPRMQSWPS